MNRRFPALAGLLLAAACGAPAANVSPQPVSGAGRVGELHPLRPRPHRLVVPQGYQRAVENGTRTATGEPGPRYWQQWASYRIRASIDPAAKSLAGSETIVYHNRSPDSLAVLYVHLFQNIHAPGAMRNEPAEVTGGVQLTRVAAAGQTLGAPAGRGQPGYVVQGTVMMIRPPRAVLPGESIELELDWSFRLAQEGALGRMGWSRDNLLYLAYWYPQMAVYDDVVGWHTDPFLGAAEFYVGFGRYEYTVEAPEGWVVMGTGDLTNERDVLPDEVVARWRAAAGSDTTVHVLTAADFGPGRATKRGANGRLTWRFVADSVRDVAFSATRESNWDAARTSVGDRDGDGRDDHALAQAFWRSDAPRWRHSVRYTQQAIRHHSEFTGVKYPWVHMTAVEGEDIIGGGMEFPMMTIIGSYNTAPSDTSLYNVTSHEEAHMWFPMIVGTDETRYGWMDEGTTNFNENEAHNDFYAGAMNAHLREQAQYVGAVRGGTDTELLRWTNYQYPGLGGFASYTKPATLLWALRGLIGEETFLRTYRKYARDWAFKHPKPWDFFAAFDAGAGKDLGWFWSAWYDEAWTLDQGIVNVTTMASETIIGVEDFGRAPMPARLLVTRQDGTTERAEVPVEEWLRGAVTVQVVVPAGPSPVIRVEIDPERYFPDVDRTNNVWPRGQG